MITMSVMLKHHLERMKSMLLVHSIAKIRFICFILLINVDLVYMQAAKIGEGAPLPVLSNRMLPPIVSQWCIPL